MLSRRACAKSEESLESERKISSGFSSIGSSLLLSESFRISSRFSDESDLDSLTSSCALGYSLPNETDVLSSASVGVSTGVSSTVVGVSLTSTGVSASFSSTGVGVSST